MSLSKHTAYNLLGTLLPLAITVVTVPLYLQVIGVERYGVLAICWVLLGYVSFLDLGLGAAVAQKTAAARHDDRAAADIFWTAFWVSAAAAAAGAMIIFLGADFYFGEMAHLNSAYEGEIERATPLLAAIVPIVLVSSLFSGLLGGRERFLAINVAMVASSTLMSLLPLAIAYFWAANLSGLIAGALIARGIGLIMLARSCARTVPLFPVRRGSRKLIGPLIRFGGWVSISGITAPLLLSLDRLAIGATLGPAAVAAYSIPSGLVSRLAILPASLSSALFPRFASSGDEERRRLTAISIPAIAVTVTPLAIALAAITEPFFRLWIGADLTAASAPIAYVLILGMWVSSFSHIAFSWLQASGRPDLISKVRVAEVIPYWFTLFAAMWLFGFIGAAIASALRVAVDCGLLFLLAKTRLSLMKMLAMPALLVAAAVLTAALATGPFRYAALALIFLASAGWSLINMPPPLRQIWDRMIGVVLSARSQLGGSR